MIWEFGYRRSKMEKIYRRIRTVYTIANTDREQNLPTRIICKRTASQSCMLPKHSVTNALFDSDIELDPVVEGGHRYEYHQELQYNL
jgi:hypothetical protein